MKIPILERVKDDESVFVGVVLKVREIQGDDCSEAVHFKSHC